MTNKTINITVHQDDIRRLADHNLGYVLKRFMSRYSNKLDEVEEASKNGSKNQNLDKIAELVAIFKETIPEISSISSYLREIEDLPILPDAEVLKDSLNLEENSLGVDGRSK